MPFLAPLYRHLLLLRFGVVNTVACALLAAAWLQGWVGFVFAADTSHIVAAIAAVFVAGLALCARRIVQTSRELTLGLGPKGDTLSPTSAEPALRLRLAARIAAVRHIANSLVILGLIGTVVGFIVALAGVDPDTAGDVGAIAPMVSALIGGMSIALHTTLVGAVLNVWLMVNYRLLETGTAHLLAALIERGGERHAPVRA